MSRSQRLPLRVAILSLGLSIGFAWHAGAGMMSVSGSAPVVDGGDIANPNIGGAFDPGGDQGHIWSNRPIQGQSFTTGGNAGGYLLNSVTLQNEENTINNNTAQFTVRIGTVSGNTFSPIRSENANNSISYVTNDYMTFSFETPVQLDPNTLYAFDWDTSGSGFTTWALNNTSYVGGEGFSSGGGGVPNDSALVFRAVDRVFHIDIDGAINPGAAIVVNAAATGITASGATLNGEVTDIGNEAPSVTIFYGDEDGGTTPGGWDDSVDLPGTQASVFSAAVSGLPPSTEHFFRARASNVIGDSWAPDTLSFTTLPNPPVVANVAASNINTTTATVGANVTDNGGESPIVRIYFGLSDAGTNADSWDDSALIGTLNGQGSTTIAGLTQSTTYFHRAFAMNSGGDAWAASTASFVTASPGPPTIVNEDATGISGNSAVLRGEVTSTGFDPPSVIVYYGLTDAGSNAGGWDHTIPIGVQSGGFSQFVTGLDPLTTYFFRARATNGGGDVWAAPSLSFTTPDLVPNSVVINEIHYDADDKTIPEEFIELHNPGDTPVDISTWVLEDGIDFTFPPGTILPANGFVLVAENPATLQSRFGVTALGPYAGKLSNDGERVRLLDAGEQLVDSVDYGVGFPWPSASRGAGPSMELINAALDNDLGGSWRSSQMGVAGPQVTYVPAGQSWRYRKGTSEASTPIDQWRLAGFTEDASWQSGTTPIGYGDGDDATPLNDMQNSYTTVFLRKEFTVSGEIPSQLLVRVYHDDAAIVWINGTEVARVNVDLGDITHLGIRASDPQGGAQGAAVGNHEAAWSEFNVLTPGSFLVPGQNIVAVHGLNDNLTSSDFSIDCEIKTPDADDLPEGVPTPGAANTVFAASAAPQIRQVDHTPQQPVANEDVLITAKVTDPDGVASVTLSYQLVEPGAYIRKTDPEYDTNWTDLAMTDDGNGGDLVNGDFTYSLTMPASFQVHRRLVRYRITVEDSLGNSVRTPYDDDDVPNFAYFCYDGVPAWTASKRPGVAPNITYPAEALDSVAVYHLITRESDVILCQWTGPTDNTYRYLGTWVYEGVVYDHMRYRIRGNASTRQVGRNKWKINFNRAHSFQARDNSGRKYKMKWDKINVLPGSNPWWRNNASTDGTLFCESVGFRAYQLAGGTGSNTNFFHFRIIDGAQEAPANDQYGGDFWGLYVAIEQPDAEFLKERNLPDGNLYNVHGGTGSSKRNQGSTQNTDFSDLLTFQGRHNSGTSQAQWESILDFDDYFAFNAMNLAINNSDMRPQENINYYHNSETDKWHILPWDIDLTFEDAPHLGRGDTPAWERIYHCLQYPPINQAYENHVRHILDLLLDNDQSAKLVDEFAGFVTKGGADNLVEASQAMWDWHPRKNKKGIWYANHNPALLPSRTWAGYMQYVKDFLAVGGYGNNLLRSKQVDNAIPNKPTITFIGTAGFPSDGLSFQSSAFSDPQGGGTFGAMEWRVAEVHNPSVPNYDPLEPYVYEIEDGWESGELDVFNADITLPAVAVRTGRTYRARVRHIDTTGRASHWSDPVEFTATLPDLTEYEDGLRITEFMYHPAEPSGAETGVSTNRDAFEFIELKNVGPVQLDLRDVRFTKGVDFDFVGSAIEFLEPGEFVLVVKNTAAFEARYGIGLPVAGAFTNDNLSNGGEQLKLSFGAGTPIHDIDEYNDTAPWPECADGDGFSLTLVNPNAIPGPDHNDPANWRASRFIGGSPGADDAFTYADWRTANGIVDDFADDDHDTLTSFMEFALGGDPALPDTEHLPTGAVATINVGGIDADYLTLSFRRQLGADDVGYFVEFSDDLALWSTIGILVSTSYEGNGIVVETWRAPEPMSADSRDYVRLRLEG